jgi:hypothetical protein
LTLPGALIIVNTVDTILAPCGDHPDRVVNLQDNPPTLHVMSRSGLDQHQTREAGNERR